MAEIRPLRLADVDAAHALATVTFADYAARRGEAPDPQIDTAAVRPRYTRFVERDAAGSWVAEADGELVGCALALRREGLWGLSLLVVHPSHQSGGLGRELLALAHDYARGASSRIILSSADPRALRAYARLGLSGHPCLRAIGVPRGARAPAGTRPAEPRDRDFLDAVSRAARGAAHGDDVDALLAEQGRLLVVPERGYVLLRADGQVRLLAGVDAAGAAAALRAAFAHVAAGVIVDWITGGQDWAVEVALAAGLRLEIMPGAVWLGGELGPLRSYLPSGAFL